MGFRFQSPWWLLALVPLLLTPWLRRRHVPASVAFSSLELVRHLPRTWALRTKRYLPVIKWFGLALLVLALARPQYGREEFRLRSEGISIEMCIDKSGSMRAMDFELEGRRVNRLEVVKKVFRDFVTGTGSLPGRTDDHIGLVAFGGFAESLCPPTLDHQTLLQILDTVQIPTAIRDEDGRIVNEAMLREELSTAIGDALALAVDRLKGAPTKSKVIVLLSDGESNAGVVTPEEGAEAARKLGIKIHTIGVGSTAGVPMPVEDAFGRTVLTRQLVRMDEQALRDIAERTGGRYFNAQDTATLQQVYAEIDRLEKTASEGRVYTQYRELYAIPLAAAMALTLMAYLGSTTRWRSLPY